MVEAVRIAEKALGRVSYDMTERESASRVFRRSLFVVQDMEGGDIFSTKNIRSIRPGNGLAPKYLDAVLGKKAAHAIQKGTPLSWELVV